MKKILVYPIDQNPYQKLIYKEVKKLGYNPVYLHQYYKSNFINLPLFYFQTLYYRLTGIKIFHLHWIIFSFYIHNDVFYFLSFINTVFSLFWIKILGYKLIWTVHNAVPHEKTTMNDVLVTKIVCHLANKLIVHSSHTTHKLIDFNAKKENIVIIPQGNFISEYINVPDINIRRSKFNISNKTFNFIFFGQIRAYKGVDTLIETFNRLNKKYPNTRLIIVGPCPDQTYREYILNKTKHNKNIFIAMKKVSNYLVKAYFKNAHVAVFPFKKITNSSSVILSLSLKKPVIVPLLDSLMEFPDESCFFYKLDDRNGLYNAMVSALDNKKSLSMMGIKGYKHVKRHSDWKDIAKKTIHVYENITK